ncbi:uncharacterized protein [Centroberyx affinis]|uniref:uncharacterized protein n=1 Tax=Centroberyx affinis TaxID=166261 RepID=UPI003A5C6C2D
MAKFRSATFLALCILQQLASSSAGQQLVRVRPGQDVVLECRGPNDVPIIALEWTRPDLEQPEYVFFYRDERSDPTYQNPSFEDRVELLDREMKNGDMSLILKNVSGDDSGIYECRCLTGGTSRRKRANLQTEPSSIISLSVEEQVQEEVLLQFAADTMAAHARASPAGDGYVGVVVGLVVVAVVACMVAAVLLMHRKCRDRDGRMGTKKQMDKNSDPTPADEACAQLVPGPHRTAPHRTAPPRPVPSRPMAASQSFLALCILLLASPSHGLQLVRAHPGQDVTLGCRGPKDVPVTMFHWSGLLQRRSEYVFFYRDKQPDLSKQDPSFAGRVELLDGEMKNGDLSLILKNVNRADSGIYACSFVTGSDSHVETSSVRLSVREPGTMDLDELAMNSSAYMKLAYIIVGVSVGVIVVACVVAVVLLILRKRKRDRNGHNMDTRKQRDKNSDRTPADEACVPSLSEMSHTHTHTHTYTHTHTHTTSTTQDL